MNEQLTPIFDKFKEQLIEELKAHITQPMLVYQMVGGRGDIGFSRQTEIIKVYPQGDLFGGSDLYVQLGTGESKSFSQLDTEQIHAVLQAIDVARTQCLTK